MDATSIPLQWTLTARSGSLVDCPTCGAELEYHQPDPHRAELLGTCSHCGAWYLVDLESGILVDLHRADLVDAARERVLALGRGRDRDRALPDPRLLRGPHRLGGRAPLVASEETQPHSSE